MSHVDVLYVIFILNQMSLADSIKTGIAKKDIALLYKLKDICDRIHATGDVYNDYGPEDLPSDVLYEEMVKLLLAYGARTDLKDYLHRTPLAYMKTLDFSNKRNAARSCMDLLKKPIRVQTHVPVDFKDSLLGHKR